MATVITNLAPTNNTDANFRLWTKGVHDSIIALGWTQTADTGQINFATVLTPAALNTFQGYSVYAMADALQASYPCYLRIDWGSGTGAVSAPAMKVQIATGTNGAGTLTGNIVTQHNINCVNASETNLTACYFSGTTSRLTMVLWPNAITSPTIQILYLNIERSLDSSGVETNTGIGFRAGFGTGSTSVQQFMPNVGLGAVPAQETKWLAFGSNASAQSAGQNLSSISGLRQAYGPLLNPELGFMVCSSQFANFANVTISRYSSSKVYFVWPTSTMVAGAVSYAQVPKFLMLWE